MEGFFFLLVGRLTFIFHEIFILVWSGRSNEASVEMIDMIKSIDIRSNVVAEDKVHLGVKNVDVISQMPWMLCTSN